MEQNADLNQFETLLEKQHAELQKDFLSAEQFKLQNLKSIYVGGGTPSLWGLRGPTFMQKFLAPLDRDPDCEFTIEVNPGSVNQAQLDAWKSIGVNRVSVGIQTLNPALNPLLDRSHNIAQAHDALKLLQNNHLNFSADLMLGLPSEDLLKRDYLSELQQFIDYGASHISVYILTVDDDYKLIKQLPSEEYIAESYLKIAKFLSANGYCHYEVSNFAKPKLESVHNLQYWRSENVWALGPSATGLHGNFRYKWDIKCNYADQEELDEASLFLESIYMRLRTNLGINFEEKFLDQDHPRLQLLISKWQADGLCQSGWPHVKLSSKGFLLLDSVMDDLFKLKIFV